jgi:hypothetical protein
VIMGILQENGIRIDKLPEQHIGMDYRDAMRREKNGPTKSVTGGGGRRLNRWSLRGDYFTTRLCQMLFMAWYNFRPEASLRNTTPRFTRLGIRGLFGLQFIS